MTRMALFQMNPLVGDIAGNARKIIDASRRAMGSGADFLVCPEMSLVGYPPKDLLLRPTFMEKVQRSIDALAKQVALPTLVGAPFVRLENTGNPLGNGAFWCFEGKAHLVSIKRLLPAYGVFDEKRYFEPGVEGEVPYFIEIGGKRFGVTICEDIWGEFGDEEARHYAINPVSELCEKGVDALINLSASPFSRKKPALRHLLFSKICQKYAVSLAVSSQVGANDHLIFDGTTCVYDSQGQVEVAAPAFEESLIIHRLGEKTQVSPRSIDDEENVLNALVLGIRDYVEKTRSNGVVVGLSGGIDSALVAAIAQKALGVERVVGIRMPSRFSSQHSLDDAEKLANNLGIVLKTVPIEPVVNSFRQGIEAGLLSGDFGDVVDQNLQARVRGMLLMAHSNLHGHLVLATGNKSEMAVGYTTLYGDMCGALAPIADLFKTEVWKLARHINLNHEVIPWSIIEKPPSAELCLNQFDTDSLPPYEELDSILRAYLEEQESSSAIAEALKIDVESVERIVKLVIRSEFKRQQAPVCLMASQMVFNHAYRLPIVRSVDTKN